MRKGSALFNVPFGPSMWRLVGAYVMYVFVVALLVIACAVAARVGRETVQAGLGYTKTAIALGTLAAVLFLVGASIFIAVKMSFFLAPVAVAERKASLIRSWELSKGNFWRLFAIALAIAIPLGLVDFAIDYALVGADAFPHVKTQMSGAELAAYRAHQQEMTRHAFEVSGQYWYVYYPLQLLIELIGYSVAAGASACAYQSLMRPATMSE